MAQDPLSLLCIEPRFPGRLGAIADWFVRKRGYCCQFYCAAADDRDHWPAATSHGLDVIQFKVGGVARKSAVPWSRDLERRLCYAYGCWEVLNARRPRGFDLALGRSATLASTLFVPAFQPGLPILNFFDYFFYPHAHDLTAELGPSLPPEYFYWRRTANAMTLLDLENGVRLWTATEWQRQLFPCEYRDDFLVLHPGIDTTLFTGRTGRERLVGGRLIPPGTRVVSFVARHLDRLRGFDRFVQLANRLLAADPNVLCIAAGGSRVQRGLDLEFFGRDYAAHMLKQTPLHDPARFWQLGYVRPAVIAELLAASDLHVYPSRPYPLAQSLLEALASGCVVLAWDSEPVRELLTPEVNGLLAAAEDLSAQVELARAVLRDPAHYAPLGRAAAALVREHYDHEVTLPRLAEHFARLAASGG
jgi:glycosyltransferase involved in cell wall biosynthesis